MELFDIGVAQRKYRADSRIGEFQDQEEVLKIQEQAWGVE